jgi:hypothetical protein
MKLPKRVAPGRMVPSATLDQMLSEARMPAGGSADLRGALLRVAQSYRSLLDTRDRIAHDSTITDGAKTVRLAREARRLLSAPLASLGEARAVVDGGRAQLQRRIAAPADMGRATPHEVQIAAEIRQLFRSAPSDERMQMLRQAIEGFDIVALRAVFSAPAALTALPPDMVRVAGSTLVSIFADAKEAQAQLDQQLEHADAVSGAIAQSVADGVDFQTAAALEEAARDATAQA